MKEIIGYKCDFCGKLYQRKWIVLEHEKACRLNPTNWSKCSGCKHIQKVSRYIENNNEYYCADEYGTMAKAVKIKMFHCNKLNKDLYPALILRKRLHKRHPEHFAKQKQMPSECEFNMPTYLGNGNADYFTFKYCNNE